LTAIKWNDKKPEIEVKKASELKRRVVILLSTYRLILAIILVFGSLWLQQGPQESASIPYYLLTLSYVVFAIGSFLVRVRNIVSPLVFYFCDLLFIAATTHILDGVSSGVGIFLIVFLLGNASLLDSRKAVGLAAVSSLVILAEQTIQYILFAASFAEFGRAGILGVVFFIAALTASRLATWAKTSEELAEKRRIDLKNMAELNEYIIQRMGSGVLVIDEKGNIGLTNDAAWYLLGHTFKAAVANLESVSPELYAQMKLWREGDYEEGRPMRISGSADIVPRFISLGEGKHQGCLIILEDSSLLNQQAQHLKLTALGRLTASIAHEIRNPLGAISHAAQLLDESEELNRSDRRLVDIIKQNSVRTNTVIENVMQLTRKEQAKPEKLPLSIWLNEFVEEFVQNNQLESDQMIVHVAPNNLQVQFDQSHLHQIMTNLCQNALKHGLEHAERKLIEIKAGKTNDARGPVLDVIDYGQGISPDLAQQIFEPFYTSASKGTGLGLYIAKELAGVNQANLDYVPLPTGGSCFRITFKGEYK